MRRMQSLRIRLRSLESISERRHARRWCHRHLQGPTHRVDFAAGRRAEDLTQRSLPVPPRSMTLSLSRTMNHHFVTTLVYPVRLTNVLSPAKRARGADGCRRRAAACECVRLMQQLTCKRPVVRRRRRLQSVGFCAVKVAIDTMQECAERAQSADRSVPAPNCGRQRRLVVYRSNGRAIAD
jgi:hypothetical protein